MSATVDYPLSVFCGMTNIENMAARGTDKQPPDTIFFSLKHCMKTIFIPTRWTNFKFIPRFHFDDFITHGNSP